MSDSSAIEQGAKMGSDTAGEISGQSAWRPSQAIDTAQWDGRAILLRSMQGNGRYFYSIMRKTGVYWEGTEANMRQEDFEDFFWDHEFMEIPR